MKWNKESKIETSYFKGYSCKVEKQGTLWYAEVKKRGKGVTFVSNSKRACKDEVKEWILEQELEMV